jgi:hypothetical protein
MRNSIIHSSHAFVWVIQSWRKRWIGHEAHVENYRTYGILISKPVEKAPR